MLLLFKALLGNSKNINIFAWNLSLNSNLQRWNLWLSFDQTYSLIRPILHHTDTPQLWVDSHLEAANTGQMVETALRGLPVLVLFETSSRCLEPVTGHARASKYAAVSDYFRRRSVISTRGSLRTCETRLKPQKCCEVKPQRIRTPCEPGEDRTYGRHYGLKPYGKQRLVKIERVDSSTHEPASQRPLDRDVQQVVITRTSVFTGITRLKESKTRNHCRTTGVSSYLFGGPCLHRCLLLENDDSTKLSRWEHILGSWQGFHLIVKAI